MLLDDPIAMYLDEGGKITPGFRLRNQQPMEVPPPDIGVPNIPMTATADTGVTGRNRYQFQDPVDLYDGEVHSVRDAIENGQSSDPLYNISNTYDNIDPLIQIANETTPIDPLSSIGRGITTIDPLANVNGGLTHSTPSTYIGQSGYGGAYTMYEDIPDLNVGDMPSFGNTEYIGA